MTRWWRGRRGEWYVVIQLALMALVLFGPRSLHGLPSWPAAAARVCAVAGVILMVAGGALLLAGLFSLRRSLTPLPYPRAKAKLVETGPYRLVRHPMYAGGVVLAFGWALFVRGWLTLVWAAVLFVFADIKSRREERWLVEKFPDYPGYRRCVRKLIPFLY